MNIVIATPGRLLQHMDETSTFDYDSLQALVMDEVDRMLDMGFRSDVDAILSNLPAKVQTLLFSATIGKNVKDLARLKFQSNCEYI
jgi:ATP-dependent RNA helicase DDX10/DBP4